jgi:hypothetical protein
MVTTRQRAPQATLTMLDVAAEAARAGFACMFSTSDEFEAALIAERRAEGRYRKSSFWPIAFALGCALTVAGAALLLL